MNSRKTLQPTTMPQPDSDGSVTAQFGGCDSTVANCLPITGGWNYIVRMYRPRPEVVNRAWKFPEAQPAH